MPGDRRVVDASAERDMRPDGGRNQGTSYARTEARQEDRESPDFDEVEENESAHQNGARQPLDGAHTTQYERTAVRYRLSDLQIELFVTAYQITGNIDESLAHAGANTRYREHAREIIRERNLRKRES